MSLEKLNSDVNKKIISQMALTDISKEELSEKLDLSYGQTCAKLRGDVDWKLQELNVMCDLFCVNLNFFSYSINKSYTN